MFVKIIHGKSCYIVVCKSIPVAHDFRGVGVHQNII